MTAFHELIEAQLSGPTVRAAVVVTFDFASGPFHLWDGAGDLVLGEGDLVVTYRGIAGMGTLSAMQQGPGQAIEEATFALYGPDQITTNFRQSVAETDGRDVTVALQFFDVRQFDEAGRPVDWRPIDVPLQIFPGTMGPPLVERPAVAAGEQITRTMTVKAQNAFTNRKRPPYGFLSDRDQKARAPGDNLLIYAGRYASKDVAWPTF